MFEAGLESGGVDLRDMPGLADGLDLGTGGEQGTRMELKSSVCGTGWMVGTIHGAGNSGKLPDLRTLRNN